MKDIREIEEALREAAPAVVDGPHRQWLKESLSRQARSAQRGPRRAIWWAVLKASRGTKVAAAILGAAMLVAAGWGAERVYNMVAKKYFERATTEGPALEITTPDGKTAFMATVYGGSRPCDPSAAEEARQREEEVKALIAAGKYEFVKSFESSGSGGTSYVYRFKLANGEELHQNFFCPLEQVTSWEDYEQKVKQQFERRSQAIAQAISKGNFRLLDIGLIKEHICLDPSTREKLSVLEVGLPDGPKTAMVHTYPIGESTRWYETPWEEHLREIEQGRRELLDVKITRSYTYQITLEDGTKTTFGYGGDEPLVKGSTVVPLPARGPTEGR